MGFKAELELDNKVYPLLLCDYEFSQTADHTGRPNPYITAGIIDIRVPMSRDDVLVDWVLQPSLMKKGTITIYKYDLSAVETTINFYNAYGLHYHLAFDANSAQTAYIDFRISAGELHLNELIHENRWNPERHQAVVTPRETREKEPPTEESVPLSFIASLRKPDSYQGTFGFDWMREEYTHICENYNALKKEYNPITIYGQTYFVPWLNMFPKQEGVTLKLEIEILEGTATDTDMIRLPATKGIRFEPEEIAVSNAHNQEIKVYCDNPLTKDVYV